MKKVVLFGDSITAGYLDNQNTDIVEKLAAKHLADMGFPGYVFENYGVNGDTSVDGVARLAEVKKAAEDAEFVMVFFGDNDLTNQKVAVADYQANLEKIVAELGAAKKVLLVGPSYVKTVSEAVLAQYVAAAKAVGEKALSFIDLNHYMAAYPGRDQFLAEDGLHFSEEGYDFFTALVARDIKEYLLAQQAN
ncbi:SGNH/GDSL hydrolase family protein [Enterococcus sp. HY326]|uniref:SGNH/GDSL hydrolase family protein n=1 Tax=Enterococcus sp. HY326 TaxID=2971265 RepID=UPI00223F3D64|nr:GDSL-type esterase/lipase family protein [Enterococcus sp. HY326]